MPTLVIGGHTRNIGKTALVVDIIRAFPEARWTAVKITQYGHGVCSINGDTCGCAPHEHPFSIDEEKDRSNLTDSSRLLVAGAARALWLRAKQGQLAEAMPLFRQQLAGAENVIIESNTVLGLLHPDLYLTVLDPSQSDFKPSALRFLDRADAIVLRSPLSSGAALPGWPGVSPQLLSRERAFVQPLGQPLPEALITLIRRLFSPSVSGSTSGKGHIS